jgi:hypothetical protein
VVQNRGHASAIIEVIKRYNECIPATPKQRSFLRYLGYRGESVMLSKAGASQLIGQLKEKLEASTYA